ncbi:MAG: hypoxanthine phosphoribosyltransferase [Bacteroidales bacterium]|nr:hypoxanthine phosphoribosyltransferase [Bacteroidales bacterium]MDZ4205037.1 hypoxanthine phosphoribosyltransferase [Bacteroidales bacterium]
MQKVTLHNREFTLFLSTDDIQRAVEEMAIKINHHMEGKRPLFLVILSGAFVFAADLLRRIHVECEVTFVRLSSYSGTQSTEKIRELLGLNEVLKGRTVIVLEDIIDTGHTMDDMVHKLRHLEASDVKIATLLLKPAALRKDLKIDYIGIEIPNDFIVGYGLDYDGLGRNLPDIYKIVAEY